MPAQEHLVGQFTDRCQEIIDITLPALAHDDAIGSIRANELRTKPNSDLMLGKDEVTSSNLVSSSQKTPEIFGFLVFFVIKMYPHNELNQTRSAGQSGYIFD